MVKIKKEVEMTLPELIQWSWKSRITEKAFYSNIDGGSVYFDMVQNISIEHEIAVDETFTVEIEEEVTDNTVLHVALELYYNTYSGEVCSTIHRSKSINEIITNNQDEFKTKCLYLVLEDMSMLMIYNIYNDKYINFESGALL